MSDRACQPRVWEQLLSAQQDLKDIAKSLGCDVKDIFTLKGRGRSATCWVHPLVFERWEKWAVEQKLKQSKLEDLRTSVSIDVEVIAADVPTVKTWQLEQIEALAKSTERYPVNFEDAWVWIGYSRKDVVKESLERNFKEGADFSVTIRKSSGGRPPECILLTADCFKQFCMQAGTEQGRAVRRYFIECE